MIKKPPSIANDPFKSAKWDEVTTGRKFEESDIPTLVLLVQWHAVVQKCIDDLDAFGEVVYENKMGDIKSLPQLSSMKQASAEIRALNKQLGINDEVAPQEKKNNITRLSVIAGNRTKRSARAKNTG